MTRFAVDAPSVIELVQRDVPVASGHQLVAPNVLRSHALSILYRDVRAGRRSESDVRGLLDAVTGVKIRLLGDRVSRAAAWRIAADLDWSDIGSAEYLAVASLQADVLVTADPELAAAAVRRVRTLPVAEFLADVALPAKS
jgi:predicted nucleic acid-binding protein